MADNNSGDSCAAFLLGGVVGGALGLLLAPRKGEETRELLADWIEESRQKTGVFLEGQWEAGKKAYKKPANGKDKHSH